MKHTRRLLAALGAAAMVAAGCGSSSPDASTASTATAAQAQSQAPSGAPAPDLTELASTLGVSVSELQTAMDSVRQGRPAPDASSSGADQPTPPDNSDMATALADELGLDQTKVAAALEDLMSQPGAQPHQQDGTTATPSTSSAS
jgi:hypothetical protein